MRWLQLVCLISLTCLVSTGCGQPPAKSAANSASASTTVTPPPAAEASGRDYPTHAQPTLSTLKVFVGTNEVTAELAITSVQVQTGMMWRTNMAEMNGMLFIFNGPHRAGFWMKNTVLPLSCAYIDKDGVVLEIHDMKPRDENSIEAATEDVQYVLEVNQGWFQRHGVGPGALMRTERGTFRETFFKRK
jgi:uncharacterized membrane protein (UPF0127 family)